MTIHVQTWASGGSARVTDMTNAGKRGKRCRTFSFLGWLPFGGDETHEAIRQTTWDVLRHLEKLPPETAFDAAADEVRRRVAAAGHPEHAVRLIEGEEVRGIDAPKQPLTAGVEGKWSGSADETGVSLDDLSDPINQPAEITHDQTNAEAYRRASAVWDKVKEAPTFSAASQILSDAGCRLHYFCRMD